MARKPLVAGNWKMNGLHSHLGEIEKLIDYLAGGEIGATVDVMICPPATLISAMSDLASASDLQIGGEDCHPVASGAHTGDISAEMIKDAGATAVIVGHSERRADHRERDDLICEKAQAAWRAGLTAIICVGETAGQRQYGLTLDVVNRQLRASVPANATAQNTIIAYEPVWAIGTGLTPTPQDVAEVHAEVRTTLVDHIGPLEAAGARLLYGGSVKPSNARELMAVENVDGALVGGASLKADDFIGIIAAYGS